MVMADGEKSRRDEDERFERSVAAKAARMRKARRAGDRTVLFGLGMFGLVGWTIVVPVVAGTLIGVWLDGRTGGGIRWTLGLMALGLVVGGVNAWNWIEKSRAEIGENGAGAGGSVDTVEPGGSEERAGANEGGRKSAAHGSRDVARRDLGGGPR